MAKKRTKSSGNTQQKKFMIHPLFWGFLAYSFFCGNLYFCLLYVVTVVLHEFVHALVARRLGYKLEYFKLSLTGASMKLEGDEFFLSDEIWVALSGPIFNLLMFVLCCGSWWFFPIAYNFSVDFAFVNLFVFLFNMLPIFSLDGGRILVCLLEKKTGRAAAIKVTKVIGAVCAILIFVAFLGFAAFGVFNFSLGVIAVFLFLSSVLESGASYQKISVLSKLEKLGENRGIVEKVFYFSGDVRLVKLFRKMDSLHYAIFMIFLGQNKGFVRLSEDDVMGLILKFGAGTILRDVISENS